MAARTRAGVIAELIDREASPAHAEAVVALLESIGMRPPAMRRWLLHPDVAHPVTVWNEGFGMDFEWSTFGALAKHPDAALAEARRYVAASLPRRRIADVFNLTMAGVDALAGGDPARELTVARLAGELLAALNGKPARVQYAVRVTSDPRGRGPRIIDRIADGDEVDVLAELCAGALDLEGLERDGMYMSFRR